MNTKLTRTLAAFLGAASLVLAASAARAVRSPCYSGPGGGRQERLQGRFQDPRPGCPRLVRVDRRLVAALRKKGRVDGIVTFKQTSILDSAQATAAVGARAGKGVVIRDAIDAAAPALASMKRRVFRSVRRDVKLLDDLPHVGPSRTRASTRSGWLAPDRQLAPRRGRAGQRPAGARARAEPRADPPAGRRRGRASRPKHVRRRARHRRQLPPLRLRLHGAGRPGPRAASATRGTSTATTAHSTRTATARMCRASSRASRPARK